MNLLNKSNKNQLNGADEQLLGKEVNSVVLIE